MLIVHFLKILGDTGGHAAVNLCEKSKALLLYRALHSNKTWYDLSCTVLHIVDLTVPMFAACPLVAIPWAVPNDQSPTGMQQSVDDVLEGCLMLIGHFLKILGDTGGHAAVNLCEKSKALLLYRALHSNKTWYDLFCTVLHIVDLTVPLFAACPLVAIPWAVPNDQSPTGMQQSVDDVLEIKFKNIHFVYAVGRPGNARDSTESVYELCFITEAVPEGHAVMTIGWDVVVDRWPVILQHTQQSYGSHSFLYWHIVCSGVFLHCWKAMQISDFSQPTGTTAISWDCW